MDFDIVFENIPCYFIDIMVSDVTGAMSHNISKNIERTRMDYKGRELGLQDEAATVDADEHKATVRSQEADEYERILEDESFVPNGEVVELQGLDGMKSFIQDHRKVSRCRD